MSLEKPKQVLDFEHLCGTALAEFVNACTALGEPLTTLSSKVKHAFQKTGELIEYGLSNSEPSRDSPIMSSYFDSVKDIVETNIKADVFSNHFSTIKEAIVALGWINVKPAPTQFIRDFKDAGEYYANRILSSNKGDKRHIEFVSKWNALLMDLHGYVKMHFLTGFTWGSGSGNKSLGGPPPPPPPPPPADFSDFSDTLSGGDVARQALLNDLNQGVNVTRNLRHVDRKNLKPGNAVEPPPLKSVQKAANAPASTPHARPPKCILEGRKWSVEYQTKGMLTVQNDDMSQSVAVYRCQETCLEVKNKANSVVIDNCKRCNIAVKSVISAVELIRCDRIKIQLDGHVPLLNMDSCDSIEIFVNDDSNNVEIISSKCTSCNVCVVKPNGDYRELPVPEQIKTVLTGNNLKSSVLEKN